MVHSQIKLVATFPVPIPLKMTRAGILVLMRGDTGRVAITSSRLKQKRPVE